MAILACQIRLIGFNLVREREGELGLGGCYRLYDWVKGNKKKRRDSVSAWINPSLMGKECVFYCFVPYILL